MKQINEIQCQSCGQMYFDDNNFCPFCGVENKNKKERIIIHKRVIKKAQTTKIKSVMTRLS